MTAQSDNDGRILSLNSGSSSLKFGLFREEREPGMELSGRIENIGLEQSRFSVMGASGESIVDEPRQLSDHAEALQNLFDWIQRRDPRVRITAVGHRVVHGGTNYTGPQVVTDQLEADLQGLVPLAPDHLPRELDAIKAGRHTYPEAVHVACFDTSFHRRMPIAAQMYALPRALFDQGIVRYGFHGLSYEYIMTELDRETGSRTPERVIVAHLGSGASMAAIRKGTSVDTTMGFTPAGGLVMGTRSGDLDPGIFPHLLMHKHWDGLAVNEMINKRAGLLGVSDSSSSMRNLLEARETDSHSAEAVELFCYQAKKFLGALLAVLGGADVMVFTGGIGENAPEVRRQICAGMEYGGIVIDPEANQEGKATISTSGSPVAVRVMKTNEELMIARHTGNLLRRETGVSHEEGKNIR